MMNDKELNTFLSEVISEARELKIPVPFNISKEVLINPRPKKRYGCCRRQDGRFQIEISRFVLDCPPVKIKNILAHEVLHTCKDCYDHGKKWKECAARMNDKYGYDIKRTSSREELGLEDDVENNDKQIRYIIKCEKCGREYPRQKYTCVMKKINAYRCNCGGRLKVIKIGQNQ